MKKESGSKIKSQHIIIGAAIVLTGVAGVVAYQNRVAISDWISGLSYTPTAEISAIEESIDLTDSAKKVLHATHPSLESKEAFNVLCDSHNKNISVLGCYTNNRIYLYDISEEGLSGVKESTMAHELLHAVWDRMTDSEKTTISALLTDVYNDEQYHSLLAEDLENYDESRRMDELHSRAGTEIVELPAELEAHYAKYFKDQNAIVMYFNDYVTPFRELSQKIEEISDRLETLSSEIEQKSQEYYELAENLSADITKFNDCANESGCFSTTALFQSARNELLTRKAEIEQMYETISNLIKEHNTLVDEYNDSIVRGQTLESIINSNSKLEEIK